MAYLVGLDDASPWGRCSGWPPISISVARNSDQFGLVCALASVEAEAVIRADDPDRIAQKWGRWRDLNFSSVASAARSGDKSGDKRK